MIFLIIIITKVNLKKRETLNRLRKIALSKKTNSYKQEIYSIEELIAEVDSIKVKLISMELSMLGFRIPASILAGINAKDSQNYQKRRRQTINQ